MKLTDKHLETFHAQGFVVVESFYPEEKRARIAAAIRQTRSIIILPAIFASGLPGKRVDP